ncbi:MAG: sugar phosphate isomerase/epimerase [Chitinophagaceae bacterium]|nr:sugar phosphate isomerase/epimerase [Chitinophagaceae bacterium]
MRIKFFCPRWGSEQIPWPVFLQKVQEAGYAGIEWFPFGEDCDHEEVIAQLKEKGLQWCIVTAIIDIPSSFEGYMSAFHQQLEQLASMGKADWPPRFISTQTGREYFSEDQVAACLAICEQVSRQSGMPIYQETHRNKWSYAAHVVKPILEKYPDTLLTFDVSHWFCVSESYLEDQQPAVEKALMHTRHIHARIGHTEGPQVYEPGSPEYAVALNAHLAIWDRYVQLRKEAGATNCTITPEFGPPPYLVFANRSGNPQQEQWRLNLWMKDLLQQRYAAHH